MPPEPSPRNLGDGVQPRESQWRKIGTYQKLVIGLVCALIAASVLYPVGRLVVEAFVVDGSLDLSAVRDTFERPWFASTAMNTLLTVAGGALLALVVASVLAWLNERTDGGLGWVGGFMPLLPILMPPIAMAAGWIFLASEGSGWLNAVLDPLPFSVDVATRSGLIFVYMVALVPYAYVTIAAALRNVDPSLEEASLTSGAGLLRTFLRVSMPAVSNAVLAAFFFMIVIGFALYSVPVVVGTRANIDIMSVRIIRSVNFSFPPDLQTATVLAVVMLVAISSAWVAYTSVSRRGRFAMISGRSSTGRLGLGKKRHVARALTLLYLVTTTILPFGALVAVSLQPFWTPTFEVSEITTIHYERVLSAGRGLRAIVNSVILGTAGGAIAVGIGILVGMAQRTTASGRLLKDRMARVVDGVSKIPAAISNVVIGLAFLLAFSGPPFMLGGTIAILMFAYVVAFMPQATIGASSAMAQLGSDVSEASYMSGAGEFRTFTRVMLPLMWPGLAGAWALVFVLMAGELPASTMLANPARPVMGFVLADIWEGGTFGQMAAFSVVVTLVISAGVVTISALGKLGRRRG